VFLSRSDDLRSIEWIGGFVRALKIGREEGSSEGDRGIGYTKAKKGEGRGSVMKGGDLR